MKATIIQKTPRMYVVFLMEKRNVLSSVLRYTDCNIDTCNSVKNKMMIFI